MAQIMNNLEILSTRTGFNSAVRHIKGTLGILDVLGAKENLADALTKPEMAGIFEGGQIGLLLRMLLVDKYGYFAVSENLSSPISDPSELASEFEKWKAVDLVVAYHHPDLGLLIANPKRKEHLLSFGALRKRELLVVYGGKFDKGSDPLCEEAVLTAIALFEGQKVKVSDKLYNGTFTLKKQSVPSNKTEKEARGKRASTQAKVAKGPAKGVRVKAGAAEPVAQTPTAASPAVKAALPAAPVVSGPRRMTPMYSVTVQNELFHNGNVEAWKRIIDSYTTKYPGLEVYIYYDGERIMNINSLFKWGKVKHGSTIQFAVSGSDIKDVAKLQRYLMQGASPMFESFLHGPVSTALKLF